MVNPITIKMYFSHLYSLFYRRDFYLIRLFGWYFLFLIMLYLYMKISMTRILVYSQIHFDKSVLDVYNTHFTQV